MNMLFAGFWSILNPSWYLFSWHPFNRFVGTGKMSRFGPKRDKKETKECGKQKKQDWLRPVLRMMKDIFGDC